MRENHDVPLAGHVGMRKTLELVDRPFHWRGLRGDVLQYVKTYPTCQMMKSDSRAKARLLRPLEIPSRKWAYVTTDLVIDLPDSDGYTAIVVFMNKLAKNGTSRLFARRRLQPWQNAKIFVDHVFQPHGLPEVIISGWDPHFTCKFWKSLFDLLGTDLHFSTAFHPHNRWISLSGLFR